MSTLFSYASAHSDEKSTSCEVLRLKTTVLFCCDKQVKRSKIKVKAKKRCLRSKFHHSVGLTILVIQKYNSCPSNVNFSFCNVESGISFFTHITYSTIVFSRASPVE